MTKDLQVQLEEGLKAKSEAIEAAKDEAKQVLDKLESEHKQRMDKLADEHQ